jgi:hypothetical protein
MVSGASGAARSQKAQQWKGPNTIGTRGRAWQKRQKTRRDMERRTRRSASTIGGAAPDSIIGGAAADRAGARPYRATRFGRPPDDITIICMRDGTLVFQVSNQAGDA